MGQELELLPPVEDMSPLDFLKAVYHNEKLPLHARLRAASAAAPFCHAKLAVIAKISEADLAERLMRALQASGKVVTVAQCSYRTAEALAGYRSRTSRPLRSIRQNSKHRWRRF
jgi:hypothetical protein